MIEYEWQFPSLDVKFSEGELKNVVTTVHWRLQAKDGDYVTSCYGSAGVPEPTPEEFISYEDLTKEEVISWVEQSIGEEQVNNYKESLMHQIEKLKAPVSGTLTPPWDNAPIE